MTAYRMARHLTRWWYPYLWLVVILFFSDWMFDRQIRAIAGPVMSLGFVAWAILPALFPNHFPAEGRFMNTKQMNALVEKLSQDEMAELIGILVSQTEDHKLYPVLDAKLTDELKRDLRAMLPVRAA